LDREGSPDAERTLEEDAVTTATLATPTASHAERDRLEDFLAFASEHQDAAIRMASRLLGGDRSAAEDVAQEAFLRAYTGLSRFRGDSSLRTWFYRILIREAQRHRRWQAVRKVWSTSSLSEAELPEPPRAVGDTALRGRLIAALERLTRRQREALVFVHLEQFTVNETAELLGTSPGTVKTHLHRALRALRLELADLREPGPAPAGGMS
jgi:RNA polymerase sigma-70 factor (ECF subfamily)